MSCAPPDLDPDAAGITNTTAIATGSLAGAVTVGADEAAVFGLRVITAPEVSGLN